MGPRDWTYILLANLSFEEILRGDGYFYFYFCKNVCIGLVGFSFLVTFPKGHSTTYDSLPGGV